MPGLHSPLGPTDHRGRLRAGLDPTRPLRLGVPERPSGQGHPRGERRFVYPPDKGYVAARYPRNLVRGLPHTILPDHSFARYGPHRGAVAAKHHRADRPGGLGKSQTPLQGTGGRHSGPYPRPDGGRLRPDRGRIPRADQYVVLLLGQDPGPTRKTWWIPTTRGTARKT